MTVGWVRGSSKCIQIKLDRRKHTYIQHSRGSIGKNAGLVPMLLKKESPSSVFMVGEMERFSALHSGVVKGFLWFRVLMRRTRDIQICLVKRTVRRTTGPQTTVEPENTSIYRFYREREKKKKVFTPVQRSKPVCYLEKKAPPCLSSTGLLASMHAWQAHADIYTVL